MKQSVQNNKLLSSWYSKVAIGILAAIIFQCKDENVAGTTSSTENPSVIAMTFKTAGISKKVSGSMQLYSKRHNPVFDSLPFAVFSLDYQDSISITKKIIDSIVSVKEPDSLDSHDSLYSLNFLIHSDSGKGGLFRGLVYDHKKGQFLDRGIPIKHADFEIDSLQTYEGGLKISNAESTLVNYLYISGTPFFTILKNETSRFSFRDMPKGNYKVLYLPTGYKVTGPITYNIIALDDSLRTDSSHVFTPISIEDTLQKLPGTPRTQY